MIWLVRARVWMSLAFVVSVIAPVSEGPTRLSQSSPFARLCDSEKYPFPEDKWGYRYVAEVSETYAQALPLLLQRIERHRPPRCTSSKNYLRDFKKCAMADAGLDWIRSNLIALQDPSISDRERAMMLHIGLCPKLRDYYSAQSLATAVGAMTSSMEWWREEQKQYDGSIVPECLYENAFNPQGCGRIVLDMFVKGPPRPLCWSLDQLQATEFIVAPQLAPLLICPAFAAIHAQANVDYLIGAIGGSWFGGMCSALFRVGRRLQIAMMKLCPRLYR